MKPNISIIVPFRDDGTRGRQCEWVVDRLRSQMPEAEVIVSTDDGQDPFNLSMARNAGFRQATADVIMMLDADTWVAPESIRAAIKQIYEGTPWVHCGRIVWLTEETTEKLLAMSSSEPWPSLGTGDIIDTYSNPNGAWMITHRDTYQAVGGYDERFRGWGSEDVAWNSSIDLMAGPAARRGYDGFHLYHFRRLDGRNWPSWKGQKTRNRSLVKPYLAAKTRADIEPLVAENRRRNGFT